MQQGSDALRFVNERLGKSPLCVHHLDADQSAALIEVQDQIVESLDSSMVGVVAQGNRIAHDAAFLGTEADVGHLVLRVQRHVHAA